MTKTKQRTGRCHLFLAVLVLVALAHAAWAVVNPALGTQAQPIKFGVPSHLTTEEIEQIQNYFDIFAQTSLYISVVRTNDPVADLNAEIIDVMGVDAAVGYHAWKRFRNQVLIVEGASRTTGGTSYPVHAITLSSLADSAGWTQFANVAGKRVCLPYFFSTEAVAAYYYGTQNAGSGMSAVAATGSGADDTRIDSCSSALYNTLSSYFGSTSCAPAHAPDRVAICSGCGTSMSSTSPFASIGKASVSSSGYTSLEMEGQCMMGQQGGYKAALMRLMEGTCEVAIVRNSTYVDTCVSLGPGQQAPSWCPQSGAAHFRVLPATAGALPNTTAAAIAIVPTRVFSIRDTSMTAAMTRSLFYALKGLNSQPSVLALLGLSGVTNPESTVGALGTIENWATDICSLTHYSQSSFSTNFDGLPGAASCIGCSDSTPKCVRGTSANRPVRIAVPISHSDTAGLLEFNNFVSGLSSATPVAVHAVVVGAEYNTLQALAQRQADVVVLDAAQAWLGFKRYNYTAIAVEEIIDARVDPPVSYTTYTPALWARNSSIVPGSWDNIYGKRICAGRLLSANALVPFAVAHGANSTTNFVYNPSTDVFNTSLGNALENCQSPLTDMALGFFDAQSCAPSISPGEIGICGGCAAACAQAALSSYSSHVGAMRGLVEGLCDFALARELTYEDACASGATTVLGGATEASGAQTWCSETTDGGKQPSRALSIVFPTVPSDVFMVRPDSLPTTQDTIQPGTLDYPYALASAFEKLATTAEYADTLLRYYGYKGVVALADPGTYAGTAAHLSALDSTLTSDNLPGLDTSLSTETDYPLRLPNPNDCTVVSSTSIGLSPDNPIKFAVPPGTSDEDLETLGNFFTSASVLLGTTSVTTGLSGSSSTPIYVTPVRLSSASGSTASTSTVNATGSPLNALVDGVVDVALLDAAQAWMGYQRYGLRIVGVEIRNGTLDAVNDPSDSYTTTRPTILVRYSSDPAESSHASTPSSPWSFSTLRGKRACVGSLNAAATWIAAAWARSANATTGFGYRNVPAADLIPPDSCTGDLLEDFANFFAPTAHSGVGGGLCAPPITEGEVGSCGLCPPTPGATCGADNRYASDEGALRGLSEGLCDVAFVRHESLASYCTPDNDPMPWCLPLTGYTTISEITANPTLLGRVPTPAFMVRPSVLPTVAVDGLLNLLQSMTYRRDLLNIMGLGRGVTAVTPTPSTSPLPVSSTIAPGTELATTTHLTALTSHARFSSVPGIYPYQNCQSNAATCLSRVSSGCYDKGTSALNPIRFALPPSAWTDEGRAAFETFFASRRNHATHPVYIVGTAASDYSVGAANSLADLVMQRVDVVALDAAAAYLGWKKYGHRVLLAERTQLSDAKTYRLTAWVRADSPYKTLSSLRGRSSCHAGYLTFSTLGVVAHGLRNHQALHFNDSAALEALGAVSDPTLATRTIMDCDADALKLLSAYYPRSCAVAPNYGTTGLCSLCPTFSNATHAMRCDSNSAYAGSWGALRGLAEGLCDVAFARESTWDDTCGLAVPPEDRPSWCSLFTDVPRALSALHDSTISPTEGLGLAPGNLLMVRPNFVSDELMLNLYQALLQLNNEPELLKYLRFPSRVDPPILGQIATEAATELALGDLDKTLSIVPGISTFLAAPTPDIDAVSTAFLSAGTSVSSVITPLVSPTEPSCAVSGKNSLGSSPATPTIAITTTVTSALGITSSRTRTEPATGDAASAHAQVGSGAVRLAIPGDVSAERLSEFREYFDALGSVSGFYIEPVAGANSISALQRAQADVVLLDPLEALVGAIRYDHRVLAVEAVYDPVTRIISNTTTTSTRTLISETTGNPVTITSTLRNETEVITATLRTRAKANPVVLASLATQFGIDTFETLRSKRSCHPSTLSASGVLVPLVSGISYEVGLATTASPTLNASLQVGETLDACNSTVNTALRSFSSAVCAPPSFAGHTGVCDLCSYSGLSVSLTDTSVLSSPLGVTKSTAGNAVCDSANVHAGERGALLGLSTRVCQVAYVRNDTVVKYCNPQYHPLGSNLPGFVSPYNAATAASIAAGSASATDAVTTPNWCYSTSEYRSIDWPETTPAALKNIEIPTFAFMVRPDTLSYNATLKLYSALEGMLQRASFRAQFGIYGIAPANSDNSAVVVTNTKLTNSSRGVAFVEPTWSISSDASTAEEAAAAGMLATVASTQAHLGGLRTFASNYLPGFRGFADCQDRVRDALLIGSAPTSDLSSGLLCRTAPEVCDDNYSPSHIHLTDTSAGYMIRPAMGVILSLTMLAVILGL